MTPTDEQVERVARAIQLAEASSLKIEGFYYANHPGGPHVIRDFRTDPRGVTIWVGEEREAYSRKLERLKLEHISRAAIAALQPQDGQAARIIVLESRQRVLLKALERIAGEYTDKNVRISDDDISIRDHVEYINSLASTARAALGGDAP